MAVSAADLADMQGLLRSGYGPLTEATYLLLRVTDAAAARRWLASTADAVTTIAHLRGPHLARTLHIALTANGMRALGVADEVIDGFAAEFISGMAGDESRSRRLGDVGGNAPATWRWGGREPPHILLMLFAASGIDDWQRQIEAGFAGGLAIVDVLPTNDMGEIEPFGFADGVSQPRIDWEESRTPDTVADLEYGNLLSVGEFVLGYRNEYGLYTDRPLLEPARAGAAGLPAAEDRPAYRDLGRNGSYLVLRELAQDVRGFWRFVTSHGGGETGGRSLAEAMVGRQMCGGPLVPLSDRPIPGVDREADIPLNQFTYDGDADGLRCPFGAHVRRANPRTPDMPGGRGSWISRLIRLLGFTHSDLRHDVIAASRFHRILRRGREFGKSLDWRQAAMPDVPDPRSGLHFICLNANIARQFEFIQNAWLVSGKFDGMSGEADPLLGNREAMPADHPTDAFTIPQPSGISHRVEGLPQFVSVRGGAYFFLPGLRALRYFAGVGQP